MGNAALINYQMKTRYHYHIKGSMAEMWWGSTPPSEVRELLAHPLVKKVRVWYDDDQIKYADWRVWNETASEASSVEQ